MKPFPASRTFTRDGMLTHDARMWFDGAGWQLVERWEHSADVSEVDFTGFEGADDLMLWVREMTISTVDTRNVRVRVRGAAAFMNASGDYQAVNEDGVESDTTSIQVQLEATTSARSGVAMLQGLRSARPMAFSPNRARAWFIETEEEIVALRLYAGGSGLIQSGSATLFAR